MVIVMMQLPVAVLLDDVEGCWFPMGYYKSSWTERFDVEKLAGL